jgi:hypothetical protein
MAGRGEQKTVPSGRDRGPEEGDISFDEIRRARRQRPR